MEIGNEKEMRQLRDGDRNKRNFDFYINRIIRKLKSKKQNTKIIQENFLK